MTGPVAAPAAPLTGALGPALEPVGQVLEPLTGRLGQVLAPVTTPVVGSLGPAGDQLGGALAPVTGGIGADPVLPPPSGSGPLPTDPTGTSGVFTGSGGGPDGRLPAIPLPGQVPAAPAAEGSGGSLSGGALAMGGRGAAAILAGALLVVAWRSRTRRLDSSSASSLIGSHPERPG